MAGNPCLRLSFYCVLRPALLHLLRYAWQEGPWVTLGFLCNSAQRDNLAIRYYGRALRKAPSNFEVWMLLSDVYDRMGDHNDAALLSNRVLAATAWREKGTRCHEAAQFQSEILYYEKALEIDPDDSELLSRLGAASDSFCNFTKPLSSAIGPLTWAPDTMPPGTTRAWRLDT